MAIPPRFTAKEALPAPKSTTIGPGGSSASLGSRSMKKKPGTVSTGNANSKSGQPPVESPEGQIPSGKPGKPGEEPKLMPEAEDARKGGIMARIAPAPPGVLAENPDPRTFYQVGPNDDSSPLIKVGPSTVSPKPQASGIDVGPQKSEKPEAKAPAEAKPEAKAIPPTAKPSAVADKEKK